MFKNLHRPTLILTLVITVTALGVLQGVDSEDLQLDIAAIETPPDPSNAVTASTAQACCRAWWNVLGYVIDRLN